MTEVVMIALHAVENPAIRAKRPNHFPRAHRENDNNSKVVCPVTTTPHCTKRRTLRGKAIPQADGELLLWQAPKYYSGFEVSHFFDERTHTLVEALKLSGAADWFVVARLNLEIFASVIQDVIRCSVRDEISYLCIFSNCPINLSLTLMRTLSLFSK